MHCNVANCVQMSTASHDSIMSNSANEADIPQVKPVEDTVAILPSSMPLGEGSTTPVKPRSGGKPDWGAMMHDNDWLSKISWSRESNQASDKTLAELIQDGQADVKVFDDYKEQWVRAGRPDCSTCQRNHMPPCLPPDKTLLLRFKRKLLAAYVAEQRLAFPTIKKKDQKRSAPASADDASQSAPKKRRREQCERCGKFHSGKCYMTKRCPQCNQWHWPSDDCPAPQLSENEAKTLLNVFKAIKDNPQAGSAFGQMLAQAYPAGPATTKKNKDKDKDN